MMNKERSGDRPRQLATCEKSNDCDGDFLQQESKQSSEQSKHDCDRKLQKRGWFIDEMRRELDARQESHSCYTKPEEFSPEEQNHDADQRADNRNSEMRRVSALSGYDFKKIHACRGVRHGERLCI